MPDEIVVAEQPRSETVRLQILQIGQSIHRNFMVLGRLLKEARDEKYNLRWGNPRWGDWVEQSSGLDMSERTAYDLVKIVETADRLQISDDELSAVKISSLKSICSLPDTTPTEQIKTLIEEAKTAPFKDVRELVGQIKNENFTYHTLKFDQDVEDNVYQPALERVRREFGSTINQDEEPEDISDSRAVELVCADFLSGAPDSDQAMQVIDAEFQDVTDDRETGGEYALS